MSCFDNIYQEKCKYEVDIATNVSTILHYQCMDFYNETDMKYLWWQELQRNATFVPTRYVYYHGSPFTYDCVTDRINFYMKHRGRYAAVMVDVSRGYLMKSWFAAPNTLYFCVVSDPGEQLDVPSVVQALKVFTYCVTNYGTGIQV